MLVEFSSPFLLLHNLPTKCLAGSSGFPHRYHLKLPELTCVSCHTHLGENTQITDQPSLSPALCSECHDGHKAQKLESVNKYLFASSRRTNLFFNHQQHLKLGNVAPAILAAIESNQYLGSLAGLQKALVTANPCQACHRYLVELDGKQPAHFPQMADCLVCHAAIDPPYSCELCHPPGMKPKPVTHTSDFMDTHSSQISTLDRSTCKVCHGLKFRCKGCH
jgi:hypothetical protein